MPIYRPGDVVVHCRLDRLIGRGGFGDVWEAVAPDETRVAFKFLNLTCRPGLHDFRALRHIRDLQHPNLIDRHGVWILNDRGEPIFSDAANERPSTDRHGEMIVAMERADHSLLDRLVVCKARTGRGLPIDELLRFLRQAAEAIDFLNTPIPELATKDTENGLGHGDVKPANLLMVGNQIKACDFGFVTMLGGAARSSLGGRPLFTPAYTSPELALSRPLNARSDQYSLAVTFYELRTGRLPYAALGETALLALIAVGDWDLAGIDGPERDLVARAMSQRPEDRFGSCRDFIRALMEVHGTPAEEIPPPPVVASPPPRPTPVVLAPPKPAPIIAAPEPPPEEVYMPVETPTVEVRPPKAVSPQPRRFVTPVVAVKPEPRRPVADFVDWVVTDLNPDAVRSDDSAVDLFYPG